MSRPDLSADEVRARLMAEARAEVEAEGSDERKWALARCRQVRALADAWLKFNFLIEGVDVAVAASRLSQLPPDVAERHEQLLSAILDAAILNVRAEES